MIEDLLLKGRLRLDAEPKEKVLATSYSAWPAPDFWPPDDPSWVRQSVAASTHQRGSAALSALPRPPRLSRPARLRRHAPRRRLLNQPGLLGSLLISISVMLEWVVFSNGQTWSGVSGWELSPIGGVVFLLGAWSLIRVLIRGKSEQVPLFLAGFITLAAVVVQSAANLLGQTVNHTIVLPGDGLYLAVLGSVLALVGGDGAV